VTEHERTAEKTIFLVVVTGLFVTCLLSLVLGVALIARGERLAGVVVLAVDSVLSVGVLRNRCGLMAGARTYVEH